jgi:hypothetical protein
MRPLTWDMTLMWIAYIAELLLTIVMIANGNTVHDDGEKLGNANYKHWISEFWSVILLTGLINILSGVLLGFYFGVLKKEAERLYTKPGSRCEHPRLNFNTPASLAAMWKSALILVGGLGVLAILYAAGITRATYIITRDFASYMNDTVDTIHMVFWTQLLIILCKVVELFIGHSWAALRTDCLKAALSS